MGRVWLHVPELFPNTVVYFHWRNDPRAPGRSWRIRDYSSGTAQEFTPNHLQRRTHDEILALATWKKEAPATDVAEPFWASETGKLNAQLGISGLSEAAAAPLATRTASASIPLLDEADLRKMRGGTALERMLTSPNSEDWVTWTVFRLLARTPGWWRELLRIAGLGDVRDTDAAVLKLWSSLPAPAAYEAASRRRMAASADAAHRLRAEDPKPVEGPTEVDIEVSAPGFLWFLEAKLRSDLSANTTYDPHRNQLARNIDVLLEQARGRRALMAMVVLDERPDRFHTQLVAQYRADPGVLHALLPHRSRAEIDRVVADLRVILWSDLLPLLGEFEPPDVREELHRRCDPAGRRGTQLRREDLEDALKSEDVEYSVAWCGVGKPRNMRLRHVPTGAVVQEDVDDEDALSAQRERLLLRLHEAVALARHRPRC